jgi:hypothetical protein
MLIVFFRKNDKRVVLSAILAAVLLLPLSNSLSHSISEPIILTNYANAETPSKEKAPLTTKLLSMPANVTIKKNATQIIHQEKNSIATQMKSGLNNTAFLKLRDSNKAIFSSNTGIAASTAGASSPAALSSSKVTADFNGDGFDDKAVGVPLEDIGILNDVGSVNVIYGSRSGLSAIAVLPDQLWTQNSTGMEGDSETGDYFGYSLSSGDYNGDGKDDLAVGVPLEDIGPMGEVGAVNIIYGSVSGLSTTAVLPAQLWTQDSTGIQGYAEEGDEFGWSLSSGDYNGDGKDDLAIGAIGQDVGTLSDVGSVNVIYGSASGLSAHSLLPTTVISSQLWTQNSNGVEGDAETGEYFGYSLSSGDYNGDGKDELAVGVPFEDISTTGVAPASGAVNVIYGSSSGLSTSTGVPGQLWTQNSTGMQDVAEAGDGFGFTLSSSNYNGDKSGNHEIDDLAIGAVGEDIDTNNDGIDDVVEAGAVNVIYGSASGLSATAALPVQVWTQNSSGVEGDIEAEDLFGMSLSSGDYSGDGIGDIAIGVPHEDINMAGVGADAGAVNVIYGSSSGLSTTAGLQAQFWTQNTTGIQGVSELGDYFGYSLSSGDYNGDGKDDLAVGVPLEDIDLQVGTLENFDKSINSAFTASDTGVVQVIYGSNPSGLSATAVLPDQVLRQGFANLEDFSEGNDYFGFS